MAKRVFKTSKKLSGGRSTYRKWSDWEVGDILIGQFKGTKIDQYDKPNWLVLVEDAQFSNKNEGKKMVGKLLGLNSAGQLDKAMEDVKEGQFIQVTYNGTSEIENGKYKGKEAHSIEVDLLEEEGVPEHEELMEEAEEEEDDL